MKRARLLSFALLAAPLPIAAIGLFVACTGFAPDDPQQPDSSPGQAPPTGTGACDPRGKFVRVDRLANVSTPGLLDGRPSLTADERYIYFQHTGTDQTNHIYTSTRAQLLNDFGVPTEVSELHALTDNAMSPAVTGDASAMLLGIQVDAGNVDLYGTPRNIDTNLFGATPAPLTALNGPGIERGAAFSSDGARIYFSSTRSAPFGDGEDTDSIFVSSLQSDGTFGAPVSLTDPTTASGDLVGFNPTPSADSKYLYFARRGDTADHVFVANLGPTGVTNVQAIQATLGTFFFTNDNNEFPGFISPDFCRLYFSSDALGDFDLFVASRR